MNKNDLINATQEKLEIKYTKKELKAILEAVLESATEALVKGEKVQLVGFATLDTKAVEAKTGVSKLQGEDKAWATEAHRKITFKVGADLKKAVK